MTISAVVHTYNEEQNILACLESLAFADERVVVDNESTDRTVVIAQAAGARIETFAGRFGYPEPARAYGLTRLTGDWVFILDADERVTPELALELRRIADDPQAMAGYWVPIRNYHFGAWLRHGGLYPDLHLRFFRRSQGSYPEIGLHRGIQVQGRTGRTRHDILHYSYRNIRHYFDKFNTYTSVEADRIVQTGRRPTGYDLLVKPMHRFLKAYLGQQGYRDRVPGLLYQAFSAAYVFASEAKAWEHYQQHGIRLPVFKTVFQRHRKKKDRPHADKK